MISTGSHTLRNGDAARVDGAFRFGVSDNYLRGSDATGSAFVWTLEGVHVAGGNLKPGSRSGDIIE